MYSIFDSATMVTFEHRFAEGELFSQIELYRKNHSFIDNQPLAF
jgi:hypothetical protein